MGYTHYFQAVKEPTTEQWDNIACRTRQLYKTAANEGIALAFEDDEYIEAPVADRGLIRFNGAGGEGYETFCITHTPEKDRHGRPGFAFSFCKTARRPYDTVACAVLLVMNEEAPGVWDIASDGDLEEWGPGFELYKRAFHVNADIPLFLQEKEDTT